MIVTSRVFSLEDLEETLRDQSKGPLFGGWKKKKSRERAFLKKKGRVSRLREFSLV